MDINLISELATAVIDWTAANAPEMIPAQQPFGAHSADPMSKTFGNNSKPENVSTSHDVFAGHTNMTGFYNPNPVLPPNTEQVPMDDYDPLETFTFWDGDTFYCNQECDANCAVSPEMTADSEMMFLPDYLGNEDSVTRDDLFQIRDLSLLHNPTLAELNSCGETLFDYSAENNYMSDDSSYLLTADVLSKSLPPSESHFMNPTGNLLSNNTPYSINVSCLPGHFAESRNNPQTLLSSSCPVPSRVIPCPQYLSAYNEKLILCPQNSPSSDSFLKKAERCESKSPLSLNAYKSTESVFSAHNLPVSDLLSSSAPPDVTMATHFPKIKVESPSSSAGFKSAEKSLSGFSSLSLSNDDESGSYFDDSEHDDDDDDFSSDEDLYQYDSDDMFSTSWPPGKDTKSQQRKHRYFWQYNLQSRGVKSQNLLPRAQARDPYILNDALDPVFSEECTLPVKHSGKARRGDGNDLTPNPRKLFSIGVELKKLNRLIYNMNPVNEFSVQTKPLSRKEKNKLASRVCRLKKKAQHEANKIKLYGLQQEHKRLLTVLVDMKRLIRFKIDHLQENKSVPSFQKLENYLIQHEPYKVAENTAEFVNEVLEKISKGEPDGGLGKL